MENLIKPIPQDMQDSDHFYKVANSLHLKPESRIDLIKFIDKFLPYKGYSWIVRLLNLYIEKQNTLDSTGGNRGTEKRT